MAKSKSKGKISASAASKSYNQKTIAKMKARDAAKAGSSTTSSTKTSTPIDYTFNSKTETPAQYNARIAAARGDSSTELAAQNATLAGKTDSSGNFNDATLATAKAQLAAAAAPTNPEAINPAVADTKLPEGTPAVGDIGTPAASIAGMQAYNKAEEARLLKQEETRQAEQEKTQKTFFESMLSPLKAKEAAQKETGIDVGDYFAKQEKGIKEIESLTKDYNAVVAARDSQIAQANDKMASMNFINNQTAQIERNAAPKLNEISANVNAKTATLQAEQGNFAEARSYVNQAVLDATADNKFKYDMYTTMYEENKDNFDRIDSIYANSFKNAMDLAGAEYEQAVKDKELIGEYMLKYPSAGLKMSDSIEEASRKIGSLPGGKVSLTADQKNYEYAVQDGYEGTFADWLGKNGSSGKLPKEVFSIGSSSDPEEAQKKYAKLEQLGMTSGDIIAIQNDLEAGKTLKEIAEESGMPNSLYLELQNNYITKFGE